MSTRTIGVAALLGVLFFAFSMNFSRGPTRTTQLSTQMSDQLNSLAARWGSGGEASVLKEVISAAPFLPRRSHRCRCRHHRQLARRSTPLLPFICPAVARGARH